MKNLIILGACLALLFTLTNSAFSRNYFITDFEKDFLQRDSDYKEKIDIEIIPHTTHGQPRSLVESIECYLSDLKLEFYFSNPTGQIIVHIFSQTGNLVDSIECDTSIGSLIYLDKPQLAGKYSIIITGDALGRGSFYIN